jgi:hypothetical protein
MKEKIKKTFAYEAEQRHIKALPDALYDASFRMDNARRNGEMHVAQIAESFTTPDDSGIKERMHLIGKYADDHGALVFCNEEGKIFVTKLAKDAEMELLKAGYFKLTSHSQFYDMSLPVLKSCKEKLHAMEGVDILESLYGDNPVVYVKPKAVSTPLALQTQELEEF